MLQPARVKWQNDETIRTISGNGTVYTKWINLPRHKGALGRISGVITVTGTVTTSAISLEIDNTPDDLTGGDPDTNITSGSAYTSGGFSLTNLAGAGKQNFKATPGASRCRLSITVNGATTGTVALDIAVA